MPIYTEPFSDEILLRNLKDSNGEKKSNKILILGCGACANISCNLYHGENKPATNILMKPYSIERENMRIKILLEKNNYSANFCNIIGLCTFSEKKKKKIEKNSNGKDTVIVMSCPGGIATVRNVINDKKIVSGMKVRGFKSVKLKLKGSKFYVQEKS